MSLLFIDSVDHYASSNVAIKYAASSAATIVAAGFRGNALASKDTSPWGFGLALPSCNVFSIGMSFKVGTGSSNYMVAASDAASRASNYTQVQCKCSNGAISVSRHVTTLGTSSKSYSIGEWIYLELLVKIGDAPNGFVTMRVNGETVLDLQGVDTKNSSTVDTVDYLNFNLGWDQVVENMYVATGADAKFYGDSRVDCLFPTGNGNYSQWTGSDADKVDNYALVDDPTIATADYVKSSTVGQIETYAYGDLPYSAGTIGGIQQVVTARKSDAGSRSIRFVCRIGGTDYLGGTAVLTDSDFCHRYIWEVNPATSAAWTVAEVNAAEFGYRVEA
jgi:hypothetical protein